MEQTDEAGNAVHTQGWGGKSTKKDFLGFYNFPERVCGRRPRGFPKNREGRKTTSLIPTD